MNVEKELLDWLWGVLLVPIGWVWNMINANRKEISMLKEKVAAMPTRGEIREAIKDSIQPLKEDTTEIKQWLKQHYENDTKRYETLLKELNKRNQ